jgi:hypothetical protein
MTTCLQCGCGGCRDCVTYPRITRCGCDTITALLRATHADLPQHCPAKARTKATARPVWCAREEHPHSEPHRVQVGVFHDQTMRWYGDDPCGAAIQVETTWHRCRYLHAAGDNAHEADGWLWIDPAPDWWDGPAPSRWANDQAVRHATERQAYALREAARQAQDVVQTGERAGTRLAAALGMQLMPWQSDALRRAFRCTGPTG